MLFPLWMHGLLVQNHHHRLLLTGGNVRGAAQFLDHPEDSLPEPGVLSGQSIQLAPGRQLAAVQDLGEGLLAAQLQPGAVPQGARLLQRGILVVALPMAGAEGGRRAAHEDGPGGKVLEVALGGEQPLARWKIVHGTHVPESTGGVPGRQTAAGRSTLRRHPIRRRSPGAS